MRILLRKGRQTELITLAKKDKSWRELSTLLNVNMLYLGNDLRKEKVSLPNQLYSSLCHLAGKNFNEFILKKLDDNWGRAKGGKNSIGKGSTKNIILPEDSIDLAEFYGIMLGDGNLYVNKGYKIGVYQVRIVGDSRHDRLYLETYVKPLLEKLFSFQVKVYKQKNANAIVLIITGKRLTEFLAMKGFISGDKIKNQLDIPSWIKNNKEFTKACLRGLYDTDGSVYKLTNQNSYQILFTNYNNRLLNDVRDSLLSLGIGVSQISRGRDITITKKSELRKFLNEVGFSNSKHLDKVKMWNLAP